MHVRARMSALGLRTSLCSVISLARQRSDASVEHGIKHDNKHER